MSAPNVPPPPDTPPRGGAHVHVDPAALAERAADKAHDAKQIAMHADDRSFEALSLSRRHAEMIELLPGMKAQLELALRPTLITRPMRGAMYAAAAALVVLAGLAVGVVIFSRATPAAPVVPFGAQATNRVQVAP